MARTYCVWQRISPVLRCNTTYTAMIRQKETVKYYMEMTIVITGRGRFQEMTFMVINISCEHGLNLFSVKCSAEPNDYMQEVL